MLTVEKINRTTQKLPEGFQMEVLDFAEFLLRKTLKKSPGNEREEDINWNNCSLSSAMRGLEDDEFPEYPDADFIEKWQ